jgi:hypothetical protein
MRQFACTVALMLMPWAFRRDPLLPFLAFLLIAGSAGISAFTVSHGWVSYGWVSGLGAVVASWIGLLLWPVTDSVSIPWIPIGAAIDAVLDFLFGSIGAFCGTRLHRRIRGQK